MFSTLARLQNAGDEALSSALGNGRFKTDPRSLAASIAKDISVVAPETPEAVQPARDTVSVSKEAASKAKLADIIKTLDAASNAKDLRNAVNDLNAFLADQGGAFPKALPDSIQKTLDEAIKTLESAEKSGVSYSFSLDVNAISAATSSDSYTLNSFSYSASFTLSTQDSTYSVSSEFSQDAGVISDDKGTQAYLQQYSSISASLTTTGDALAQAKDIGVNGFQSIAADILGKPVGDFIAEALGVKAPDGADSTKKAARALLETLFKQSSLNADNVDKTKGLLELLRQTIESLQSTDTTDAVVTA